jgi:hypothetical protein
MANLTSAFHTLQRKGIWRRIRRLFTHECSDLLPTNRVLRKLPELHTRYLGIQTVPIERIVGSSGRSTDFDLDFNPLRSQLKDRWLLIARASSDEAVLPPIRLLRVGNRYLVEDGHHRISVSQLHEKESIRAHVIELEPEGLREKHTCSRLGYEV